MQRCQRDTYSRTSNSLRRASYPGHIISVWIARPYMLRTSYACCPSTINARSMSLLGEYYITCQHGVVFHRTQDLRVFFATHEDELQTFSTPPRRGTNHRPTSEAAASRLYIIVWVFSSNRICYLTSHGFLFSPPDCPHCVDTYGQRYASSTHHQSVCRVLVL